jgi:uncharacterized protein (DUF433 family)
LTRIELDALRRTPAYPFSEGAHYLNLPTSTLRAWCLGQEYPGADGETRQFQGLITLDGRRREGLSFLNLIEAHVLAAIRRLHGVSLQRVRGALAFTTRALAVDRPLASVQFQTNGIDLFVEELGTRLLNVSRDGQVEIADLMRAHLRRVQRDPEGVPIKLYPFTRRLISITGDEPAPVEIDPRIAFGRPVLVGRAVPTAVLADRFKAGDSFQSLAEDYETSTVEIEEAIRCELDRRQAA